MNNKIITTISIIAVLVILAVNINSNAFAQNSTEAAPCDQPIGNGTDCYNGGGTQHHRL
jgi:FlaG/FlaF family flagellin (archaellin)